MHSVGGLDLNTDEFGDYRDLGDCGFRHVTVNHKADEYARSCGDGPRGLFVWGRLVYCDVFGKEHKTDFCQHLFFVPKDGGGFMVDGFHAPGRNTAT